MKYWRLHLIILMVLLLAGLTAQPAAAVDDGPEVLAVRPSPGSFRVELDAPVTVLWNRAMMPTSDFLVAGPDGLVNGRFFLDDSGRTVTFQPDGYLRPATRYTVLVAGQVDAFGLLQSRPLAWSFTTVSPTSVSLADMNGTAGLQQSWWWTAWPGLMILVSLISLIGFARVWRRRLL